MTSESTTTARWVGAVALVVFIALLGVPRAVSASCEQTANISPLPGSVIAINSDGVPDGMGAVQINIPVAYTPANGYFLMTAGAGGLPDDKNSFKNKTGVLGTSFGGYPRVWLSGMIVSRVTATAHTQILLTKKDMLPWPVTLAFGVQSLVEDSECPRSFYGVATGSFDIGDRKLHVTGGVGSGRFNKTVFGGLSYPINDNFNFAAEYDGREFGTGVAVRPQGRYGQFTLMGGYHGQSGWLAAIGFSVSYSLPEF